MPTNEAMAINQNYMAAERTELSKVRTSLALNNSRLAAERTHLSYLRTIVTLLGSAATLYQALPLLGVSKVFTAGLTAFLLLAAAFFIYKDATTYPRLKKELAEIEQRISFLADETEGKCIIGRKTKLPPFLFTHL